MFRKLDFWLKSNELSHAAVCLAALAAICAQQPDTVASTALYQDNYFLAVLLVQKSNENNINNIINSCTALLETPVLKQCLVENWHFVKILAEKMLVFGNDIYILRNLLGFLFKLSLDCERNLAFEEFVLPNLKKLESLNKVLINTLVREVKGSIAKLMRKSTYIQNRNQLKKL